VSSDRIRGPRDSGQEQLPVGGHQVSQPAPPAGSLAGVESANPTGGAALLGPPGFLVSARRDSPVRLPGVSRVRCQAHLDTMEWWVAGLTL